MDSAEARRIARRSHRDDRDRFGDLVVEHVARVAAAVPAEAEATAWLHDALEGSVTDSAQLRSHGLTEVELAAIELLTRAPGEEYELYLLRIAYAPGDEGRLARCVKLADLDDHLAHRRIPHSAPPYAWARRHIVSAQFFRHESLLASQHGAA
jgi:hypothetical protein